MAVRLLTNVMLTFAISQNLELVLGSCRCTVSYEQVTKNDLSSSKLGSKMAEKWH